MIICCRNKVNNKARKGRHGVSTNGVAADFVCVCVLTEGLFGHSPYPTSTFYLPKSDRAYLFPQSVQIPYFCSGPISVDPICPQPRHDQGGEAARPGGREEYTLIQSTKQCIVM